MKTQGAVGMCVGVNCCRYPRGSGVLVSTAQLTKTVSFSTEKKSSSPPTAFQPPANLVSHQVCSYLHTHPALRLDLLPPHGREFSQCCGEFCAPVVIPSILNLTSSHTRDEVIAKNARHVHRAPIGW